MHSCSAWKGGWKGLGPEAAARARTIVAQKRRVSILRATRRADDDHQHDPCDAEADAGANGTRPEQHPLLDSLANVHRASGRAGGSRNVVLGLETSESAWRCLDERVHTYPYLRDFTAIGEGGEGFADAMVSAVAAVVGPVERETQVSQRPSRGGNYVSVTVGPVVVTSPDSVVEVYQRMRSDGRLRYWL